MTTLLLSENFPPKTGGSSRWFWEIYRRLPLRDYLIAAGEHPAQAVFDRTHALSTVRLPLTLKSWGLTSVPGFRGYWEAVGRLRRIVKARRVTMIHCGRCLPEGVMALILKLLDGVPYACYVHGEDVRGATTSRELSWLATRVLRAARFVIPNSDNTRRILRSEWNVPPQRIRLLHPGVDTRRFVPAERSPAVRRQLGWHDRPVVLTVGRLQKRKGHDQMILALPSIRRAIPDVLYAIVGDGEEREFLEELVKREGLDRHVLFLGERSDEDLVHCYQQCDLFALANRQVGRDIEGFGMVLLEAQACGKPVVAGASGGTAETMRIPDTGQVVCCDGPHELGALVTELLGDPRRRLQMGRAARQWVVERFDWTSLSRQAAGLFAAGNGQSWRSPVEAACA